MRVIIIIYYAMVVVYLIETNQIKGKSIKSYIGANFVNTHTFFLYLFLFFIRVSHVSLKTTMAVPASAGVYVQKHYIGVPI